MSETRRIYLARPFGHAMIFDITADGQWGFLYDVPAHYNQDGTFVCRADAGYDEMPESLDDAAQRCFARYGKGVAPTGLRVAWNEPTVTTNELVDRPTGRRPLKTVHKAVDGDPACGAALPTPHTLPARFDPWLKMHKEAEVWTPVWASSFEATTCSKCKRIKER